MRPFTGKCLNFPNDSHRRVRSYRSAPSVWRYQYLTRNRMRQGPPCLERRAFNLPIRDAAPRRESTPPLAHARTYDGYKALAPVKCFLKRVDRDNRGAAPEPKALSIFGGKGLQIGPGRSTPRAPPPRATPLRKLISIGAPAKESC